MYQFKFSGTVKTLEYTKVTDHFTGDFGYTRRPYQMFLPVCENDLSGCVVNRDDGPLAISIPAARPVLHDIDDLESAYPTLYEGYCKNLFWLISELYERTDLAQLEIPVFVSTNEAGYALLSGYAQACQFPPSQIIVHPNKFLRREKKSHVAHGVKFDALAHDRLQHFTRVLHIDASQRVKHDAPHIWDWVLNEWNPEKKLVHGGGDYYNDDYNSFADNLDIETLQEITGIQNTDVLRARFYEREKHPHLYGQVFGGNPTFWRNPQMRAILWRAQQYIYGDETCFSTWAIATELQEEEVQSLEFLVVDCLFHMEPFTPPPMRLQNSWNFEYFGQLFHGMALCHERHGEAFHMELQLWDADKEEPG